MTRMEPLDDAMFAHVDTEEKAYLVGWIASQPSLEHGRIEVYVHERDETLMRRLRDVVSPQVPLRSNDADRWGLSIESSRIVADVCALLGIEPGHASGMRFPRLATEDLRWAFVRGLFDGGGAVSAPRSEDGLPYPQCTLRSPGQPLLDGISALSGVPARRGPDRLEWSGNNAIDFMGRLYDDATIYLSRHRDLYIEWCMWVPGLTGPHGPLDAFRWVKTLPEAVAPKKEHATDSGYDLTLIEAGETVHGITFFRTGIKVQPPYGWYFDLVPRSSITKTGYMLANCVGVIDRSYAGEIMVPLLKHRPDLPDLALPARVVQLIPRPIVHLRAVLVDDLDDSRRGDGGFGSTGA